MSTAIIKEAFVKNRIEYFRSLILSLYPNVHPFSAVTHLIERQVHRLYLSANPVQHPSLTPHQHYAT